MSDADDDTALAGTMLLDADVMDDPYPFYDRLRREAPMWQVPGTNVFAATSHAVVTELVGRTDDFSNNIRNLLYRDEAGLPQQLDFGENTQKILASADAPEHTLHRKTVFPDLVAKRMTALAPDIDELARTLLADFLAAGGGDFMAAIGNAVPITMISRLIGFQNPDHDRLMQAASDSTMMVGASSTIEDLTPLIERTMEIGTWIAEQMTSVEAPDDALITTINKGIDDGVFTLEDGAGIVQMLLSAGGESTTSLLGTSVRILAENPELQTTLRDDPDKIPTFVEEALRLESPFRMQMRSVPADTSIGGVDVPAGATVCVFFSAANRDPEVFDDADEVRLDRKSPRVHLAFGRGAHFCVGSHLARVEAVGVLTALLDVTSSFRLDPHDEPVRVRSLLARRHDRLPILVEAK